MHASIRRGATRRRQPVADPHRVLRRAAVLWLAVAAGRLETADAATTLQLSVADGGNLALDATSQFNGESPQLNFVLMMPGSYLQQPIWAISKFSLSLLPAGTTAADVISATLSIPDTGVVRAGQPAAIGVVLQHFATSNNQMVVNADRHEHAPALTHYGVIIPAGGTGGGAYGSVVNVDVTAAIKGDLQNGRALSCFRVGHDPAALAGHATIDAYQFGSADCAADPDLHAGFCPPAGAPNVMRLTVLLGPIEECANGLDDDGDGLVDCDDAECVGAAACPHRLPDACFENTTDYTYMWWADGLRDPSRVFNIQTSRYGLSFDYDAFQLTRLGAISAPAPEPQALHQDNSVVDGLAPASMTCVFETGGSRYQAVSAGPWLWDCRLVDSGRYFQRRWLDAINWSPDPPSIVSRLEVAAWPDRVGFNLHVTPDGTAVQNGALEIALDVDSLFSSLISTGNAAALCSPEGDGYVLLASGQGAQLTVDEAGTRCTVRAIIGNWPAGDEKVIGLIVYPVARDCALALEQIATSEISPLSVSVAGQPPVQYDPSEGWHRVSLPDGGFVWPDNDWIQRLDVTVENPSPFPRIARFNFANNNPASITGVSVVLRDLDGYPTGIPVQLSKNWHSTPSWIHDLTLLTVPPLSSVGFEFTCVYAHWGGVAAASHAQLSLVGYPYGGSQGNQLWDQSAMGSWGESITFDPELTLGRAMVDDVRPMMVGSDQWTWTGNVGGADFLVYQEASGLRHDKRRMRTRYRRYCPNLTEVTYAGQSDDGKIDLACTVSLHRTDDLLRGSYHIRYDVREPVSFSRMGFFQMGADNYNESGYGVLARGDENGLIQEWPLPLAGNPAGIPCTGHVPWFSMHEGGPWANRGLVIRSWNARLGGQVAPVPHAAILRGNTRSAIVELTPPPGVAQLLPGDYVEADVVQVIVPLSAADYYGPNTQLEAALAANGGTWRMIHREAAVNHLKVRIARGTLEDMHPLRIRAANGHCVEFTITGGLGYVPVTICGLSDYRIPPLQRRREGIWTDIDQSVHGSDFWQTDYEPASGTWEATFTVPLDNPQDARLTAEFRMLWPDCPAVIGPGDIDADGDTDQSDFGRMQVCLTGLITWVTPDCTAADLDGDNRVDWTDVQAFLGCMSGPNVPADPQCLNR